MIPVELYMRLKEGSYKAKPLCIGCTGAAALSPRNGLAFQQSEGINPCCVRIAAIASCCSVVAGVQEIIIRVG